MAILLCGMMGAGKTTYLKKWEREVLSSPYFKSVGAFQFYDLDVELLKYSKRESIDDIFKNDGERFFRSLEQKTLKKLLSEHRKGGGTPVIALGGGALELMPKSDEGLVVWANTPLELCLERALGDEERPMAQNSAKDFERLYERRRVNYEQSHIKLSCFISFKELLALIDQNYPGRV